MAGAWLGWTEAVIRRTSIFFLEEVIEYRCRLLEWQSPPFAEVRHSAREAEKNPPPPPEDVADKLRKAFALFAGVNGGAR